MTDERMAKAMIAEGDRFLFELEQALGLASAMPESPPATFAEVGAWLRPRADAVLAAVREKVPANG